MVYISRETQESLLWLWVESLLTDQCPISYVCVDSQSGSGRQMGAGLYWPRVLISHYTTLKIIPIVAH